ncbi:MAG: ABC transporter ATP-binding protein [Opitutales bacterium]
MPVIKRVSKYLFAYPWLFGITLLLALSSVGLMIAVPQAVQMLLENIRESATTEALGMSVALIVALYVGAEVFNGLRIFCNNTLEQKVLIDMRGEIHNKLLRLPISFFDQRKSGDISNRVIEDVSNVERALLDGTEQGSTAIAMLLGVSVMLFVKNAYLAMFVLLPIPVLLVLGYFYSKGSRKVWKQVREASGEMTSLLVEDIQGNRLIQTFGLQDRETARFNERAEDLKRKTLRGMYRWATYSPLTALLTRMGTVAVVGVGGWLMLQPDSDFTYEKLVAFLMYVYMVYEPVRQLHGLNHLLSAGKSSGERVFEIIDEPVAIENAENPVAFPTGLPRVDFRDVTFGYPDRPPVLQHLRLTLEPGKVTALVGHTGAGKSTIANLAMRAYDVTGGEVVINGVDLREIELDDLHRHIGHVAQEPFLFEGTVRDNLRLAKEEAEEAEMWAALRGAAADEFVAKLPDKLDTNIGEKGIRLSQGEKQRLTIARVLLKNPPFVILDEATASVDTITEKLIQQALKNLMSKRTVLVIAHRLSTVREADKIVVLDHGKILEQGTHEVLRSKGGRYAELWSHQVDLIDEQVGV